MEEINIEPTEKRKIYHNIQFIKWYFTKNKAIISESEKQKIFSILSYSMLEDPYIFLRVLLYIANTRRSDEQEIAYKIIIHFLGTMFPEICIANLDLFIKLGKKDDILYFMQCQNITQRIMTYIGHQTKIDSDFAILLEGKIIGKKINRQIRYQPKLKKGHHWDIFLYKILDDPTLNGITI